MDGQPTYNFIKFRYDCISVEEHPYSIFCLLFNGGTFPAGVVGVETQNAYGADIKRHIHFHFMTTDNPETIRKRFIRAYPVPDRGRGWYSLKPEKDVKDFNHFFRYCVKQIEPSGFDYKFTRIPLPDNFDIKLQNLLAYEEWSKSKEILTKKSKERDSRLSVYEKIIDKIQQTSPIILSVKDSKLYVLNYYLDNDIPPQKQKILDMAYGISIRLNIISREQYLDL